MKLIAGTISLCFAFCFFLFLSLLKNFSSGAYTIDYQAFPIILTLLSIIFFGLEIKEKSTKKG
ncbi:hypothetical protein LAV73_23695 [Lysinibacillus xylanilyticus]|uniref:hypothetical protein n=1 Tax=Lysinibacillus xylanilyticus TaxID=582475 RepID=UPI002B254376|nr:hypothetical protein [Lysinibacillus xylanilyticus]MEB2282926.1 hypothetical protein [Lysinibacillus xylanilyticus]